MTSAIAGSQSRLDVRDLVVAFPETIAVRGIDITVAAGETLALVGESGCGKSATALAIMRLLPPTAALSGQLLFDGLDLAQATAAQLREIRGKRIALIQQEPMTSLNPVLPIGYQVYEVLRRHQGLGRAAGRRRVVELLDLVGIPEPQRRYDDYPHNFSGGMRQRVAIAIAIACEPQMIIADEPTTALDVTIQAQVLQLLDRLRRQMSMAMLLITHDLGIVAQWADRVAVMYAGHIVEEAPGAPFFRRPAHPYARGLLGAAVGRDEAPVHYTTHRLAEIRGSVATAAAEPGCSFAPRCPEMIAACRAGPPALESVGPGRSVACIVAVSQREDRLVAADG